MSTSTQSLGGPSSHEAPLVLSGEIDMTNAANMRTLVDQAIRSTVGTVRLDMGDVTYVDSSGLRVLLATSDELQLENRRLMVVRASRQVERLFEVCGVSAHLLGDISETQLSRAS